MTANTTRRILIVEDEVELRMLLRSFLAHDGYEVSEANNVAKARQILDSEAPFDLIITDLELPGMSGMDFLDELTERAISTPILVSTGHKNKQAEAMERGASHYLRKPFGYAELSATVKGIFEGL
jgi:DNA-binding response OmpR family regulator